MRTKNINQWGFIVLEFVLGFVFALIAFYCCSSYLVANLSSDIFFTFIAMFVAMMFGVVLVGYLHLNAIGLRSGFWQALGTTLLGMIMSIILYLLVNIVVVKIVPHYITAVLLPLLLPLVGMVLGWNYSLRRIAKRRALIS